MSHPYVDRDLTNWKDGPVASRTITLTAYGEPEQFIAALAPKEKPMPKTQGVSPKAVLAAVIPSLGGLVAIIVQWIATGAFDRAELATAIGTVLAAVLSFAGAWAGSPGDVTNPERGPASDDQLMASSEVRRRMAGYSVIEMLFALILLIVAIIVIFALLDRL